MPKTAKPYPGLRSVAAENFKSFHNHSAHALIEKKTVTIRMKTTEYSW